MYPCSFCHRIFQSYRGLKHHKQQCQYKKKPIINKKNPDAETIIDTDSMTEIEAMEFLHKIIQDLSVVEDVSTCNKLLKLTEQLFSNVYMDADVLDSVKEAIDRQIELIESRNQYEN